jgi:DNA helicase-2/ATP-dependent DNA helicase PcrA
VRVVTTAEEESARALAEVLEAIDRNEHFALEAGAGAGKTHTLVKALEYLLRRRRGQLSSTSTIACITYTNIARDEIRARIDHDPIVRCDTIHGFAWDMIAPFQKDLRLRLSSNARWRQREDSRAIKISLQKVQYSLGIPDINASEVRLHHTDVIRLFSELLAEEKFRRALRSRYSHILIDEYQDADKMLMESIKANILGSTERAPLIGLFGDYWQQIYQGVCGKVEHEALTRIGKGANFRSVPEIVSALSRMRPELPQIPGRDTSHGSAIVLHTNRWSTPRLSGGHWTGDLPPQDSALALGKTQELLESEGWQFDSDRTKVLMLTHRQLAAQQGYSSIPEIYEYSDTFRNLVDPHLAYFVERLEPSLEFYEAKRYGAMYEVLGSGVPPFINVAGKRLTAQRMDALLELRQRGSVGDVVDFLETDAFPPVPSNVRRRENRLRDAQASNEVLGRTLLSLVNLRAMRYEEIVKFSRFHRDRSSYATKHGVKGAEFDDVLVVVGRGWNMYNFGEMLDTVPRILSATEKEIQAYVRSRNLFYVGCSRARNRLAVLFTQHLTGAGISTLERWFEANNVIDLPV